MQYRYRLSVVTTSQFTYANNVCALDAKVKEAINERGVPLEELVITVERVAEGESDVGSFEGLRREGS